MWCEFIFWLLILVLCLWGSVSCCKYGNRWERDRQSCDFEDQLNVWSGHISQLKESTDDKSQRKWWRGTQVAAVKKMEMKRIYGLSVLISTWMWLWFVWVLFNTLIWCYYYAHLITGSFQIGGKFLFPKSLSDHNCFCLSKVSLAIYIF